MIVGRYYTAEDVSIILNISIATIRHWTRKGEIPCAVRFGSDKKPLWRYPCDEFDTWEQEQRATRRAITQADEKRIALWPHTKDG